MPLISQSEYGRRRGVSRQYIGKLVKMGKIPGFALRRVGKRNLIYSERADKALESTSEPKLKEKPPKKQRKSTQEHRKAITKEAQTAELTYTQARTEFERFRAGLKKLQFLRESGELLPTEEVRKAAFDKARIVRDSLLNIPSRLSAELAAETSPQRVEKILNKELRLTLEELSRG